MITISKISTLQTTDVETLLDDMAAQLRVRFKQQQRPSQQILVIGIRSGGVWVAEGLAARLKIKTAVGALNIAYHRDDFGHSGRHPLVEPSHLSFEVSDRHVLLVDDVLYTGRTIRAALNEIFDFGRPASVTLAVLVDRGGRELPVQADVCGTLVSPQAHEDVKLCGPKPLRLQINKLA